MAELKRIAVIVCLGVLAATISGMPVVSRADDAGHHKTGGHARSNGHGAAEHGMNHAAAGHGDHGAIWSASKNFPTIAYDEVRRVRPPQKRPLPALAGDAAMGKKLAYDPQKGRCLNCHILGPDGDQPGNLGPALSAYGKSGRERAYTFQRIWDARVQNPSTLMPPFGTNGLLTEEEVTHIVAYVQTLATPVPEPKRPDEARRQRRERVWVAGEDLTTADQYIEAGHRAFEQSGHNGRSCASCHASGRHGPDLRGVAAGYPKFDAARGRVISLDDRINLCRVARMDSRPFEHGTSHLNTLTSYVKYLSRGVPIRVKLDGPAAEAYERGKGLYRRKAGQLNFSCADCHGDQAAGKWIRGQYLRKLDDTAGDWPKHFVAGHDLGQVSLQQRIQHCQIVTGTYPLKPGSGEYTDMELYLTALANGTPIYSPTKSRLGGE